MKLSGKTVLITGAKQGMGLAIAKKLKQEGADLILNDKNSDANFEKIAKDLDAKLMICDLSNLDEISSALNETLKTTPKLDALVAQHAYISMAKFEDQDDKDWWKVVETNLLGTYVLVRESLPYLLKSKGKVVITSSYWGLTGWKEASAYSASKAGLISLVKSLGRELAPMGVNVNGIAPGVINTPQLEVDAKNLNLKLEKVLEMYAENIPLARVGESFEIASVVSFLLDPEQNAMVGQIVNANGGEIRSRA
ncbi:MAG: SDR family NAD(P)-dependent oxidoreductase [Actinomycetes bacterium]